MISQVFLCPNVTQKLGGTNVEGTNVGRTEFVSPMYNLAHYDFNGSFLKVTTMLYDYEGVRKLVKRPSVFRTQVIRRFSLYIYIYIYIR